MEVLKDPVTISLPLSKSMSNRRLLLDALAGVKTPHKDVAECHDTEVMLRALEVNPSLGATIDVDACGTALRFLTAYYATFPESDVIITGTERLCQRPVAQLVDALRCLGAEIEYCNAFGCPPIRVRGRRLSGGSVTIADCVSSQFVSALMMVAPAMPEGLTITLNGETPSLPYIFMTSAMMADYGVNVEVSQTSGKSIQIYVPSARFASAPHGPVEADWSAASFWYEIMALCKSRVNLPGLKTNSLQGDAQIQEIFSKRLESNQNHLPLNISLSDTPDLMPPLVALCCGLDRKFCFTSLGNLRFKESNRLVTMQAELKKLGYLVTIEGQECIKWNGERCMIETNPRISTHEDHRIAMAMAPLAVVCGCLEIENPEVVEKSYPGYWSDLQKVGFRIEMV